MDRQQFFTALRKTENDNEIPAIAREFFGDDEFEMMIVDSEDARYHYRIEHDFITEYPSDFEIRRPVRQTRD